MAETSDYDPGEWKGHDFTAARKAYDVHVGRSYGDASAAGKVAADLVPASIETNSKAPVVILCDVTGSMGKWPATIFSKLPYLDKEGKEYLGEDMEISFAAIGDAFSDKYPLQIRTFSKGLDLPVQLKELVIEGGGGGQSQESYELGALYYARNAKMPNAVRPILIFIGDESLYEFVEKRHAKDIHVDLESSRIDTKDIFEELKRKFSVYVVRKPYDRSGESAIQKQWVSLLGEDHVAILPSADRVVDVIFGFFAKETNRVDYFHAEIEGRQNPDQIATVYKSLKTVHVLPANASKTSGKSIMHVPGAHTAKKSKGLLP